MTNSPIRLLPPPSQSPGCTTTGTTHLLAAPRQRETANTPRLIFPTRAPVPRWQLPKLPPNGRKASSKCKCTNHHVMLFYSPAQKAEQQCLSQKGHGAGAHSTARGDTTQRSFECCWTSLRAIAGTSAAILDICGISYPGQQTIART